MLGRPLDAALPPRQDHWPAAKEERKHHDRLKYELLTIHRSNHEGAGEGICASEFQRGNGYSGVAALDLISQ